MGTSKNIIVYKRNSGHDNSITNSPDTEENVQRYVVDYISNIMGKDPSTMLKEAEEEARLEADAVNTLKQIEGQYNTLSKQILASTKGGLSVKDSINNIKKSNGVLGVSRSLIEAGDNAIEKIPVIGSMYFSGKQMFMGKTYIDHALKMQFQAAASLKDRLGNFLYGDKGSLKEQYKILGNTIQQYELRIVELKRTLEDKKSMVGGIETDVQSGKNDLEHRLSAAYENLNPDFLGADDTDLYYKIQQKNRDINSVQMEIKKTESDIKSLSLAMAGKKTTQASIVMYQVTGEEIHQKLDTFLRDSQENITAMATVAEAEKVMVDAALQARALRDNYNKLLILTSQHSKILAEHGERLVPDSLHDPAALVKAMTNIIIGAQRYSARTGSNRVLDVANSLEAITNDVVKEQRNILSDNSNIQTV